METSKWLFQLKKGQFSHFKQRGMTGIKPRARKSVETSEETRDERDWKNARQAQTEKNRSERQRRRRVEARIETGEKCGFVNVSESTAGGGGRRC